VGVSAKFQLFCKSLVRASGGFANALQCGCGFLREGEKTKQIQLFIALPYKKAKSLFCFNF
jgi:hypothetical protein